MAEWRAKEAADGKDAAAKGTKKRDHLEMGKFCASDRTRVQGKPTE